MNFSDTIDLENYYSSSTDYLNNQNSINFIDKSFEDEQNLYPNKDDIFETQLDKSNFISNTPSSEILKLENDINIFENPINNINAKNLLFIPESQKESKTKSLLGRKKANSGEVGKHSKFAEDNMIRKFKPYFKNSLKDLVNFNIQKYIKFPNNMINGIKYKKLEILDINQEQAKDVSVDMNKALLKKTIKEFFKVKISRKYSNYPDNFNELLINELYMAENGEKVTYILEKTFLECLKYFRMDKEVFYDSKYSCLKGLEKSFLDFKKQLFEKNNKKYANDMIDLINNFETIYNNKKSRAKRKKIYKI